MYRVLVVAVSLIIKIISVTIMVDKEVYVRIIPDFIVVISWPVVNVQRLISLSGGIVLIIIANWVRLCRVSIDSI